MARQASDPEAPAVAVLGLGEAGSAIAAGLVDRGLTVTGWDPRGAGGVDGVSAATDAASAVEASSVVVSLNSATVAVGVAREVSGALTEQMLFADMNTAAPSVKRAVAEAAAPAQFADVALVAPVPGAGLATPALVSGPGAARFAALFGPLGMPVTEVGAEPGAAAARKLARSVFAKGTAAAIGEALEAARRLGCEDWLYHDIAQTLEGADRALLDRWIQGSRTHAARRAEEMDAAAQLLSEAGVEPRVARATEAWLRELMEEETR